MNNEEIVELIMNPFNKSVMECNSNRSSDRVSYSICIKNKGNKDRIFIDTDDLEYFKGVILLADKDRLDKKLKIKEAKKLREDERLKKLEGIKDWEVYKKVVKEDIIDDEDIEEEVECSKDIGEVIRNIESC